MELRDRVLTVPEAARLLGVGERTYYAAVRRNEVPAIRIGRRLVVPGAALERFLVGEGGGAMNDTPSDKESGPHPTGSRA